LWYSIKSGFESLGRVKERETRLSGRGTVAVNGEAPQDIQRTPQIVDRIGCNGAQAHGCGGILDAHRIKTAPRFPFCLDDDSVRVSLEESFLGRVQIEDVLFGPFDLDAAAGIPGAA